MQRRKSPYQLQPRPGSWRRLAVAAWRTPRDPTIYAALEVDVTESLALIEELRAETGVRVTVTHLVAKSLAMALAEFPSANGLVIGRRIYQREDVDIFCQVSSDRNRDLSGVKIARADRRSVVEIAQELERRAERVRAREDREVERTKAALDRIPAWILALMLRLTDFATYHLGFDLSRFGIAYDGFGSAMVSSIGAVESGLATGFAPLFPVSHVPIVLLVNRVVRRPVVVGDEIVIRPILNIGCTIDHRFIDGVLAARIAARVNERLTHAAEQLDPRKKSLRLAEI